MEARFTLDRDSICYACKNYTGRKYNDDGIEIDGCETHRVCENGNQNEDNQILENVINSVLNE